MFDPPGYSIHFAHGVLDWTRTLVSFRTRGPVSWNAINRHSRLEGLETAFDSPNHECYIVYG